MKILSIDVGIINFGMVGANLKDDYLERKEVILECEIFFCEYVDITQLGIECKDPNCVLFHDKLITDYMLHLFEKFKEVFDSVDKIIIERQPINGLIIIQELIIRKYREKSELVHPSSMHAFFGIRKYNCDERKEFTEKIATEYLGHLKIFVFNERRHDMADAFCILYFYLTKKRKEFENKNLLLNTSNTDYDRTITDLSQFIYNPDE